jgi:hypothetical protein
MQVDFGRPSSSMRVTALTTMVTSVMRHRSVRAQGVPNHSFKATDGSFHRLVDYTRVFSARPCVHARRCFGDADRWIRAVLAVSLNTAIDRGDDHVNIRMALGDGAVDASPIVSSITNE